MKKILFATVFFSAAFIIGCKNKEASGNPTEVLTAFFDAIAKKDLATAKELVTPDSQGMINMMEGSMNKFSPMGIDKLDKSKVEFGTAVITGDDAKVPVKDKASGETIINFPLKNINGQWKVALDLGSLMEMVPDQIKAHGMNLHNLPDSLRKKLDSINMKP
jgi:hypothetical protein